jgi:hypothetical protein
MTERLSEHNEIEPPTSRPPVLERRFLQANAVAGGHPRHVRIRLDRKDFRCPSVH